MKYETGWLGPDGTFVQCNTMEHIAVARNLVEKFGYQDFDISCDEVLMNHGWVHITISMLFGHEFHIYWAKHLTEVQKQFLRPYFEQDYMPISRTTRYDWEYEIEGN